jgi:hypothetical protein
MAVQSVSHQAQPTDSAVDPEPANHPSDVEPENVREPAKLERPISWQETRGTLVEETADSTPAERPGEPRPVLSRSFSGPTGYLSNRRNMAGFSAPPPALGHDDSFRFVSSEDVQPVLPLTTLEDPSICHLPAPLRLPLMGSLTASFHVRNRQCLDTVSPCHWKGGQR